jgi:hypothetical protein
MQSGANAKLAIASTAFVRFNKMGKPIDDVAFCEMLQERTGVMLVPGSIFHELAQCIQALLQDLGFVDIPDANIALEVFSNPV